MTEKISLGPPPGAVGRSKSDSWRTDRTRHVAAYDAIYGVKDSPATMALPGALVGRFTDWDPPVVPDPSPRPPVALSRRARARLRAATGA